jgi:ribonuclease D
MLTGISPLVSRLPSKVVDLSQKDESLAKLVQRRMNLVLDKTACQSNWAKRPLRKAQLDYAGNPFLIHQG